MSRQEDWSHLRVRSADKTPVEGIWIGMNERPHLEIKVIDTKGLQGEVIALSRRGKTEIIETTEINQGMQALLGFLHTVATLVIAGKEVMAELQLEPLGVAGRQTQELETTRI